MQHRKMKWVDGVLMLKTDPLSPWKPFNVVYPHLHVKTPDQESSGFRAAQLLLKDGWTYEH